MTDVSEVEWHIVWDIFREFVLPHSGTLILNVVLFGVLGVVVSIIYAVILYKKGVFRRKPKYYNWSVKLYYPLLIGGIIFFFGQVGFVRGVYKIIDNEKDVVVTGIYNASLQAVFESEESKDAFVTAQVNLCPLKLLISIPDTDAPLACVRSFKAPPLDAVTAPPHPEPPRNKPLQRVG